MSESKQVSENKKSGNTLILIVAILVLLALAGFILLNFGNPQWHPKLYAYQAKNVENNQLDPSTTFSGAWNNWDQDGKLKSTFHYRNGKKDGSYIVYNSTGGVLSEGQYKAGELDGLQKIEMEDGSRTEIPYENGKRSGVERSWYPGGELAVEAPWVDGEQEGSVTYYFESGAVHSSIPYYKGKREGVHKTFHETGAPQGEEQYRDDELNGPSEFRRIDGTPEMALNYRDGKLDGIQIWYNGSGKKSREATMLLGIPHGEWREWDDDGKLIVEEMYDMGELKKPEQEEQGQPSVASENDANDKKPDSETTGNVESPTESKQDESKKE